MALTNDRLQWSNTFHIGVREVQVIVHTARLHPRFYSSIEHLDRLVAMENALWFNYHTAGNIWYSFVIMSTRALLTRAATRQFYRSMAPLHQERVNILVQLL